MSKTAKKTDPKLWEAVKHEVVESGKGGRPGQLSARKAQLATQEYKQEGGGYVGRKSGDNSLRQWQEEDWGTKSGRKSTETGERYLPKTAREDLSDEEYRKTTEKKRADTRKGKQFSRQPKRIAEKTARHRATGQADGAGGRTKAELMAEAKRRNIRGRSRMRKDELADALGRGG